MLDKLKKNAFEKQLGETFKLKFEDDVVWLELVEVDSIGSPAAAEKDQAQDRQESFSIVFRGPHEPPLEQSMYVISQRKIGEIDGLFLVPIAADDDGRYYEAIFN
jgi:hypothetical protein